MLLREGQSEKEAALRKYFMKPPDKIYRDGAVALLAIGAILFIGGLNANLRGGTGAGTGWVVTGILLLGFGTVMLSIYRLKFKEGKPKPSDSQVERWREQAISKLTECSRIKLNLDEQEDVISAPLVITGPILWETNGVSSEDLVWRRGDDGDVRFGVYGVTIIHLTDRHLASYACAYNFIRDVALNECTDEFHYRDVVSVSTRERDTAYTLPTGKKLTRAQAFSLSVASGESISVTTGSAEIKEIIGVEKMPENGADKAVATIRAMLRDKKG